MRCGGADGNGMEGPVFRARHGPGQACGNMTSLQGRDDGWGRDTGDVT